MFYFLSSYTSESTHPYFIHNVDLESFFNFSAPYRFPFKCIEFNFKLLWQSPYMVKDVGTLLFKDS